MARPALRRTAVLLTITALLAGCGTSEPTGPFPPRPADIDTTTVDLCTALTAEQQNELGVGPGEPRVGRIVIGSTRACLWSNFDDGHNYTVQTLPEPAAVATEAPGTTVGVVGGYGVVESTSHAESFPLCEFYVDASDEQALRIQVQASRRNDDGSRRSLDQVCDRAETVTAQVLENLRGR
ncbi:hypothetical protein GCM10009613_38680 [Pseudonocardia kongjuensis]|uniref:DUF3558 domain-containing protein n=1 Tax=Pseudonocardia kongjuensis TaxID=102227 RepID=A0ABP4IKW3_9PSEU